MIRYDGAPDHGEFERGDIVRVVWGIGHALGVVVGFPSPNLTRPITPTVLVFQPEGRFGGWVGGFAFLDKNVEKLGRIENYHKIPLADIWKRLDAWVKENRPTWAIANL